MEHAPEWVRTGDPVIRKQVYQIYNRVHLYS